jgi:hypothetical protein
MRTATAIYHDWQPGAAPGAVGSGTKVELRVIVIDAIVDKAGKYWVVAFGRLPVSIGASTQ